MANNGTPKCESSASLTDFRYRQIHLDFHTSEHIAGVAENFDPDEFVQTLRNGEVDSVTLFARCHHGWCYYPTNVGKPHPHLRRPDLLGDMIKACHEADIATPVYISVQWDEVVAREHPEWRVMQAQNRAANYPGTEPSAMNQLTPTWHTLCINHKGYVDYLVDLTREVVERYNPPGLFMDILGSHECTCNACLESMKKAGLDPLRAEDRQANDRAVLIAFFKRLNAEVHASHPECRMFYNSGHIFKGQRDRYDFYGHLELESLPTGGWGYDHLPTSARYADTLGKDFLGMTGRFHTHWGEFGGYKRPEALEYECCHMIALGARCSIGDQLHPKGRLNADTYDLIRPAYQRVKKLEPFARNATYVSEVAILSNEALQASEDWSEGRNNPSDDAAARMLLEMHIPFDVIDADAQLNHYRLLILPDDIRLDTGLAKRLETFVRQGGAVISTGCSGLWQDRDEFALDIGAELEAPSVPFDPSYLQTQTFLDENLIGSPIVMYDQALALKATDGEELAHILPSYFNRSWDRFCSHLHTPEDPDAGTLGTAIVQKGKVVHVAYPLFKLYGRLGQPLYKYLFRGLVKRVLPDQLIRTSLPSAGRVSVTRQKNEDRTIVHLLYAPTQLRGRGIAYNDGETRAIEIIEDVPVLNNIQADVRLHKKPRAVHCAYDGAELDWDFDSRNRLRVHVPEMHIHSAIVIDH
ncbi:alpha-amylase family protein [Roseibium sp. SCP14]|uniref:alpha-amylase family protein n=1 Tax=Roseibium sp. SCP14 TaxID=3141375 RepID=UPI00333D651C